MVAHVHILLRIKLLKQSLLLYGMGKLCSKFGDNRSINSVTILSTDGGWAPDTGHVTVILYSVLAFDVYISQWLVEQGLTSHSTQFRSFRRRCFYRSDDPTNSVISQWPWSQEI